MNKNKLIISDFHGGHLLGFQISDDKLVRIHNVSEESVLGNIYCGYVKDVVKNINAAFIEFDKDKKGYFSLKKFTEKIHQGDKVLVQVAGDKIKSKDYTLTSDINLNSECLVLTVGNTDISISRKIGGKPLRDSLKETLKEFVNEEYGFILRTNSVEYSAAEIKKQAQLLIEQWQEVKRRFEHASAKSAILKRDHLTDLCRVYIKKTGGDIITDNMQVYRTLSDKDLSVIYNEEDKISLSNKYSLEKHLSHALNSKVWLKSGAYLVIEPTEALTVIDVNTGKAECRTNRNETIKKINIEAAHEIIRQIQVRNLSGIIIVDFINMEDKTGYIELEQLMQDGAKGDFSPCYIVGFTKLGLMEISRKKIEKPLHEIMEEEL
ncbi:MAG: ribonuclease E/G [Eubacterium sp.]